MCLSSPFVSRVTSGIDVQESAEQNFCRRLCGDRAAPSVPSVEVRGASSGLSCRTRHQEVTTAQFVVRYTLSSIVIRCFNHCLQPTPNNVLRVLLSFRWNEQFIAQWNISLLTLARGFSSSPCLRRVSRIWLYEIALPQMKQINLGVDGLQGVKRWNAVCRMT